MKLLLGLALGAAFGAALQMSGASSHTKMTDALRFKDLTIIKLILMAIGVGMIGVNLLDTLGLANIKIKDLFVPGILVAGLIFGVGFALTGYCPGTALAAAAEGKADAWMVVLGGLAGAMAFAVAFPELEEHLMAIGRYGKVTLHGELGLAGLWLAVPLGGVSIWLAFRLPIRGGR